MYKLTLEERGGVIDERDVSSDEELLAFVGRFSFWYFLALEAVDYRDAYNAGQAGPDALLAFTCDKADDEPDGPHRHGMPHGILAHGYAWPQGRKTEAFLKVKRAQ